MNEVTNGTKDYVALYRDENGTVVHSENANGEYRQMQADIKTLTAALEHEIERHATSRELLDQTRRLVLDQDRKILAGRV
jgi:hypothetical protein